MAMRDTARSWKQSVLSDRPTVRCATHLYRPKRVELARALATRPQLLLLDEWLAGLNPTDLQIGIELIAGFSARITVVMVEQ